MSIQDAFDPSRDARPALGAGRVRRRGAARTLALPALVVVLGAVGVWWIGGRADGPRAADLPVDAWVTAPEAYLAERLAARGSAPIVANESAARNAATMEARARLAAVLRDLEARVAREWTEVARGLDPPHAPVDPAAENGSTQLTGTRLVAASRKGDTLLALVAFEDPSAVVEGILERLAAGAGEASSAADEARRALGERIAAEILDARRRDPLVGGD